VKDAKLRDALDGLYAYDQGSMDSGIRDENLRRRCIREMAERTGRGETCARVFLSRLVRDMWLSDAALEQGYGIEDAQSFICWLGERMGITV
jgi:hypothetical protein